MRTLRKLHEMALIAIRSFPEDLAAGLDLLSESMRRFNHRRRI